MGIRSGTIGVYQKRAGSLAFAAFKFNTGYNPCPLPLTMGELCRTHIFPKRVDTSSVPGLPGCSFQQRIHGGVLSPPRCPDKSGPRFFTRIRFEKTAPFSPSGRLSGPEATGHLRKVYLFYSK